VGLGFSQLEKEKVALLSKKVAAPNKLIKSCNLDEQKNPNQ
jgi:hypothetical protein